MRMAFEKESNEMIKREYTRVMNDIQNLAECLITIHDTNVVIRHELILTMVDGKIINAIEENVSSVNCRIYIAQIR
jgi:hypothetical protein